MRTPRENPGLDLTAIRNRLAGSSGPEYWRSLEEAAGTEEFQSYLHREFPEQADDLSNPETRRGFLRVMGASLALAGVSGCAIRTPEKIVPWVKSPENVVPGRPQFFATAMTLNGLATGVLVESHSGRPTKIEGNPDHPASLGSTDIFAQAATSSGCTTPTGPRSCSTRARSAPGMTSSSRPDRDDGPGPQGPRPRPPASGS